MKEIVIPTFCAMEGIGSIDAKVSVDEQSTSIFRKKTRAQLTRLSKHNITRDPKHVSVRPVKGVVMLNCVVNVFPIIPY